MYTMAYVFEKGFRNVIWYSVQQLLFGLISSSLLRLIMILLGQWANSRKYLYVNKNHNNIQYFELNVMTMMEMTKEAKAKTLCIKEDLRCWLDKYVGACKTLNLFYSKCCWSEWSRYWEDRLRLSAACVITGPLKLSTNPIENDKSVRLILMIISNSLFFKTTPYE